uniref:Uncharacterized protein n=1 Tax=Anguilla anguilla TaxID=7936 RepID=A0A0E9WUC8_ANGAN
MFCDAHHLNLRCRMRQIKLQIYLLENCFFKKVFLLLF